MRLELEDKEQELQQMRALLESVLQEKSQEQPQPQQSEMKQQKILPKQPKQ